MDGNAGYNQIFLAEEDIPKTAFRCPGHVGLCEWIVMTFVLKNAGATYRRSMNFIFHEFISKLVEIYIDDVVVMSGYFTRHLADLRKVLECTRKHGLKINPNKCAFGVSAGQFLGLMVHQRGIEISMRSIDTINKIVAPTNKTELQSLISKINFIRQFISNLLGKIRAFSPLLKLKADQEFVWGKEQQLALDKIKNYLANPPVLDPPSSKVHKFILVATDYFTKWVEAIPLKKVTSANMIDLVKEHIVYRFGIPQTITTDLGTMFTSGEFDEFAISMGIKVLNSSPYYAQANGKVEASNKGII